MAHKKNRSNKTSKLNHFYSNSSLQKGTYFIFGKHPVIAALKNPLREKLRLLATPKGRSNITDSLLENKTLTVELVEGDHITSLIKSDNPHQGLALEVKNLPGLHLKDISGVDKTQKNIILVLDQVTDPHNIGAIMRSAAAFGAKALVTTDRNAPPETGTLAKTASGALDIIPWVRVGNLASALDELADAGYWRIGLDGHSKNILSNIDAGNNIVLILGSEGKGMREGTTKKCDFLARLPISDKIESLNVSNAAAVALYSFNENAE